MGREPRKRIKPCKRALSKGETVTQWGDRGQAEKKKRCEEVGEFGDTDGMGQRQIREGKS